jgi:metal-responsive CopG/Arc/MetJ family transcriptional regulator
MEKIKTQIVFPDRLLKRLDQVVKRRQRSHFVVEAVEEKLRRISAHQTLKQVAGICKDREDLKSDADVTRYVKRLRAPGAAREQRLKKAHRGG